MPGVSIDWTEGTVPYSVAVGETVTLEYDVTKTFSLTTIGILVWIEGNVVEASSSAHTVSLSDYSGETVHFYFTFTMPAHNVILTIKGKEANCSLLCGKSTSSRATILATPAGTDDVKDPGAKPKPGFGSSISDFLSNNFGIVVVMVVIMVLAFALVLRPKT